MCDFVFALNKLTCHLFKIHRFLVMMISSNFHLTKKESISFSFEFIEVIDRPEMRKHWHFSQNTKKYAMKNSIVIKLNN